MSETKFLSSFGFYLRLPCNLATYMVKYEPETVREFENMRRGSKEMLPHEWIQGETFVAVKDGDAEKAREEIGCVSRET